MDHSIRDILSAIVRDIASGKNPRASLALYQAEFPNPYKLLDALRSHVESASPVKTRRQIADRLARAYPNNFSVLDFYCETFKKELNSTDLIRLRSRAASLQPKSKIATVRLAEALEVGGRPQTALEVLKATIRSGLSDEILHFKAGYYASLTGAHSLAIEFYKTALKKEIHHRTLLNLASAARHVGDIDLSEACAKRAILLRPETWDAYYNLANLKRETGNVVDAVRQSFHAEKLNPNSAGIKWNLSHALMASGDFERGLKVYRYRWSFDGFPTKVRFPGISNVDDLSRLTGRLFVYSEQGVGDNLLFARFIPQLLQHLPTSATATFECYESILTLFKNSFPSADLTPYEKNLPKGYDHYVPLFDIPALLGAPDVATQNFPYLQPSLRNDIPEITGSRPKVGLVWAGNPKFTHDQQRSAKFDDIHPLLAATGVDFYLSLIHI